MQRSPSPLRVLASLAAAFALHALSLAYLGRLEASAGPAPGQRADAAGPCSVDDLGFTLLPRAPPGYGDALPYALAAATLALSDRARAVRFLTLGAALMAARSVCVAATAFPPSDPLCRADSLALLHGGCRDKVFSGHVAYTALSALFLQRRGGAAWRSGLFLGALLALEAVYLVAAREHYTVDVLVAALVAFLLFRAYGAPTLGAA